MEICLLTISCKIGIAFIHEGTQTRSAYRTQTVCLMNNVTVKHYVKYTQHLRLTQNMYLCLQIVPKILTYWPEHRQTALTR